MRILSCDCSAGISGDMNLGVFIDLGVDPGYLNGELGKLGLKGWRLDVRTGKRKELPVPVPM